MHSTAQEFIVPVSLLPYRQETINRIAYLFPEIEFSVCDSGIQCRSDTTMDHVMLNQEIRYCLFRTKIRAEGQADRSALYAAVFR